MLSTCAKLLRWCWYFGFCSTQVPNTYSVSQLLPSHGYWWSNSHAKVAEIDVYTRRLENWMLLCCQLVPNCFNDVGILDYALHRYPTHIRSPNYCRRMCICQAIAIQKSLKLKVYTLVLGIRLLWCSQRVPNCLNDGGIWDSAPHRYRSPNYCRRMCICPAKAIQESLKLTFIHPVSKIDCFYALNLCQTDAMMLVFCIVLYTYHTHIRCPNYCHHRCICQATDTETALKLPFIHSGQIFDYFYAVILCQTASMTKVFWSMFHTGTPHIFGLPTTAITFALVNNSHPKVAQIHV